jgi:hypothetical protein
MTGRRHTEVVLIECADGARIQPTREGVDAIERLVRNGWTLALAARHIAGGPAMFRDPLPAASYEDETPGQWGGAR